MLAQPGTSRRSHPVRATARPAPAASSPLAFLFTDLQDSTGLYERVGDDEAYEIVRRHFAFVGRIVVAHRGAVVKTTGDGVMATFDRPGAAVRTALAIQTRIGAFNRLYARGDDQRRLVVKLGIHWGGSLRSEEDCSLDYFGSAVNLAARLRGHSQGGDIVLSDIVADHPGVRLLLARLETRYESLPFKGFRKPIRVVRVMPAVDEAADTGGAAPSHAGRPSLLGATRALWVLGDPRPT
jgi:class 3 adenylate cyclase